MKRLPSWLLRHPLLLADWVAWSNAIRQPFEDRSRLGLLAAIVGVSGTLIVAAVVALAGRAAAVIESLLIYRVLTFAVAAMYVVLSISRRRRRSETHYIHSWLIAAPIDARSVRVSHAIRSFVPVFALAAGVLLLIIVAAYTGGEPLNKAMELAAYIGAGVLAGSIVGWLLPRRRTDDRAEGSRYVPRAKSSATITPSFAALSGWPSGQLMAWSRPENSRIVLIAALFAVQGGSSAVHGLTVVAIWLLAGYLSGLLTALMQAGKAAATWLRSTPISFAQFVWSIARRALLYQLLGTTLAAGVMLALSAPIGTVLYLCSLWMVIVLLVTIISLADSYRGRSPVLKLVMSLVTMAAIESRARAWSFPLAAGMALWQLRPEKQFAMGAQPLVKK